MKFLNFLLLFFILQNPFIGTSQTSNINHHLIEESGDNNNQIYFLLKESFPKNKKGQLFLNTEWQEGIITDFQNNQFKIPIRYRIYQEEMQVEHTAKTKALQTQQIKKIEFDGYTFIASNFILHEAKFMSFFEVVNDGKIQLLNQYISEEKNGVCSIKSVYYSKKGKNAAERINLKKKYILELMNNHKTEVQKFMKDKKINLKKSDNLKKLFTFYNSL